MRVPFFRSSDIWYHGKRLGPSFASCKSLHDAHTRVLDTAITHRLCSDPFTHTKRYKASYASPSSLRAQRLCCMLQRTIHHQASPCCNVAVIQSPTIKVEPHAMKGPGLVSGWNEFLLQGDSWSLLHENDDKTRAICCVGPNESSHHQPLFLCHRGNISYHILTQTAIR
jgi:hypothetical protein